MKDDSFFRVEGASVPNPNVECLALLFAVLERALHDAIRNSSYTSAAEAVEAREWILETDEEDVNEPFTFLWLCDALNIPPEKIRRALFLGSSVLSKARKHKSDLPRLARIFDS